MIDGFPQPLAFGLDKPLTGDGGPKGVKVTRAQFAEGGPE